MSESPKAARPGGATLRRSLGLTDLVLLTIGTVIGSGIFLVPSAVLRQSGLDPRLTLLVWTLGGLLSLLGALTYAELGAMRPEAGGLYVYIRDAFGPLPAFLYGWTSFFVIASGSVATLAVAFAGYVGGIVPMNGAATKLVAVAVVALTAGINIVGTRRAATVQNWTTAAKVLTLIALSVAFLVLGGHGGEPFSRPPAGASATARGSLGAAMIGVLWAYEGWAYVTFSAGETRDPQRTFPRAISVAALALIGVYVLANVGYLTALGTSGMGASDHVAVDAVRALVGPAAGTIVGTLILVSIFSATNGLMLTAPRLYYAMARDGVFFRVLARVNPRLGTPAFAISALAVWSAALAISGTFEQLLTYVVFTGWIFYGLAAASILVYRRTQPNAHRPFRVPGYPLTPILFVGAAGLLVLDTLLTQPRRAAFGVGAVLIGTPAFYLWRRRTGRPVGQRAAGLPSTLERGDVTEAS
jgi:APA family basic amino acid/polyamine antiporter